jgi:hypothetical protein
VLAATVVACSKDTDGTLLTPPPLAGLRYINVTPDTSGLDFRVVDIVGDAPNTVGATFRTGGAPYGVATAFLPPHFPVRAGTRTLRVFVTSTNVAVASQVVWEGTFDFVQGTNYTLYLYGYARTGSTPAVDALITTDNPNPAAGKYSVRLLNLASTLAGNPAGSAPATVDARVTAVNSAAGGTADFTAVGLAAPSGYVDFDVTTGTAARVSVQAPGTAGPNLLQAFLPVGTAANPNNPPGTQDPIPGTAVAGTGFTAVIVPRSVAGSAAPQTTPAAVSTNIDSLTRSNDTVTVWRAITLGNGTTTCDVAVAAGAAANDIIHLTGMTAPELNGSHVVVSVTAGTNQTVVTTPAFACTGTATPSRFRVRVSGTPASPAAGTPTYRIVNSPAAEFGAPYVLFVIDRLPPRITP